MDSGFEMRSFLVIWRALILILWKMATDSEILSLLCLATTTQEDFCVCVCVCVCVCARNHALVYIPTDVYI